MPVRRPYNAIGRIKAETVNYVSPGQSTFYDPYGVFAINDANAADISISINGVDDTGVIVWYIRDLYTQVGDHHVVHPGSAF